VQKYIRKYSFCVALVGLLTFGCKKDNSSSPVPPRKEMFHLPQDTYDFFNYQVGERRVYFDSLSGERDTLTCEEVDRYILRNMWGDTFLFDEEAFKIKFRSSKDGLFYTYKSKLLLSSAGREEFLIEEVVIPWGNSYLATLPFNVGKQIEDIHSGGTAKVNSFTSQITISGITFLDVYQLTSSIVNSRIGATVDYYFARNKGLVAIKNYKTNKLWVLQEVF
jgi:hypothetical protein